MSFTAPLKDLMAAASVVHVDGFDIDGDTQYLWSVDRFRVHLGGGAAAFDSDQEVEVDPFGIAYVFDTAQVRHEFEFEIRVSRPLQESDLQ
jgi:hypothetical protein